MSQFSKFDRNYPTGGVFLVILFITISGTIENDLTLLGGQIKKVHMMKSVVGHKCVCLQQTQIRYLQKYCRNSPKNDFKGG